jgi:GTPase SAR1 family protein
VKDLYLGGKEFTVECWDTGGTSSYPRYCWASVLTHAGQEKFRTVTASFFRDADVVLFCAAVDDEVQFSALDDWLEQYRRATERNNNDVAICLGAVSTCAFSYSRHSSHKERPWRVQVPCTSESMGPKDQC